MPKENSEVINTIVFAPWETGQCSERDCKLTLAEAVSESGKERHFQVSDPCSGISCLSAFYAMYLFNPFSNSVG